MIDRREHNVSRFIRTFRSSKGMTMIEMTFASGVLLVAITTMLVMFDTAINIYNFTTARSLATQLANEEMESIRSLDYEQVYNSLPTFWPDDPDLNKSTSPPKFSDIDGDSQPVLRTIVTSDTASGLLVEKSTSRKKIDFTVRSYVLWVDDASTAQAFKRLVVKINWEAHAIPGHITYVTNYSKEDKVEPRPSISILGVRSTNFNYFRDTTQDTTMGADDSIRGPLTGVITPIILTEASANSARATGISKVLYTLYSPDGDVAANTEVITPDMDGYYRWNLNTTVFSDGSGYLIKAEAIDTLGNSGVDALRINIDNTAPTAPNNVDTANFPDSAKRVRVSWEWQPSVGDDVPAISRFIVYRRPTAGSWTQRAALPEKTAQFIDINATGRNSYKIKAVDTAGNVAMSPEKERINLKADPTDLWPPAVVSSWTAEAISWKTAEFIWTPVTDVGSGVAGYSWRSTQDSIHWTIVGQSLDLVNNPIYYQDPGLKPGITYHYVPYAFDKEGNEALPTVSKTITTPMR